MATSCKYDIDQFISDIELPLNDIAMLYSEFIKELKLNLEGCRRSLKSQDYIIFKNIIHNIKGITINYRIDDVYLQADLIYCNVDNNNIAFLEQNFAELITTINTAELEIKRYFSQKGLTI